MKVLILFSPDEIRTAERVAAVCRACGSEPFSFGDNGSCKSGLYSCLKSNDLILIIWDDESIQKHEITFSAGYCVGKDKPFVLYRKDKQAPPLCNGKAIVVSKEEELKVYITSEVKKNKRLRKIEAAKSSIAKMGFDFCIRDLVEVISKGEIIAVEQFLIAGFSSDICDKNGVSLLNIAIRKGQAKIASILMDNGADINKVSRDRGNTPVMDAAAKGNAEILTRLIAAGANLDIKSKSGQTALVLAVGRQAEDTALALIDSGADIDIEDDLGMTAKKYAELFKLERVLLSLMDKADK